MFVASGIASTTSGHERKKGYTFLNPSLLLGGRGVGVEIVASDQHTLERGPPPRCYEVLIVEFSGEVYKSGKQWTVQSIFDTPLGRLPPPAGLGVAGLFLSLPRKGVCSKQECAQLEVCNF